MKIGELVQQVPRRKIHRATPRSPYSGRWGSVWRAVDALSSDAEFIPVELDSVLEARRLRTAGQQREYRTYLRGNVVYVGRKLDNGAKP